MKTEKYKENQNWPLCGTVESDVREKDSVLVRDCGTVDFDARENQNAHQCERKSNYCP
jgi:hypothetical protein